MNISFFSCAAPQQERCLCYIKPITDVTWFMLKSDAEKVMIPEEGHHVRIVFNTLTGSLAVSTAASQCYCHSSTVMTG